MKANIHPENYRTVLFYDSGANEGWLIRSCADTHGKTMVWNDGKEYPLFSFGYVFCFASRLYGQTAQCEYRGRASKFNQRFQSMISSFRKDK